MTQLSALPVLSVQIAFSPTNLYSLTQTWTDVTPYVRDFQTKSGRQHFLDRIEAATLNITLNNRSGFFSSGSTILNTRMPIQVTATYSGVTYPVYYGIIDTVTERLGDILNIDLDVQASDLTKYLSLRYMNSPAFWKNYTNSASAIHWYDCNVTQQANIVSASGNGTTVTYNYAPGNTVIFTVGQQVTVTGLIAISGSALNGVNVTVTATGSGYFQIASSAVGTSSGQASAYVTQSKDLIGSANGTITGVASFTNNGAIIYEVNTAIDLANGSTSAGSAYLSYPAISGVGGIDFWVLGAGIGNISNTLLQNFTYTFSGVTWNLLLSMTDTGQIQLKASHSSINTSVVSAKPINDGYWHHVGIMMDATNGLSLYCDGAFYSIGGVGSLTTGSNPLTIGDLFFGYVDEIVVSNYSNISTLATEFQNRYKAGSLLQLGYPTTANYVWSGDRIAEILCLAGYGSIGGGNYSTQSQVVLNANTFYINDSATPWAYGATNGYCYVEPYYWDSPITGSTALDLILQVTDTDIGIFYQEPNGTFSFYDQSYYGNWSWSGTSGTWTPTYSAPDAAHTWTDDNTGVPYYGPTLQVVRDDADLWTTVKVTPQAGTDQIYENTANEPRWGYTTLTKSGTVHTSLNAALSTANYLGYLFQSPIPRVANVELRAETANGTYIPAMLNAEIGDPVNFQRNPSGASSGGDINTNYVIESISHDFQAEPGQWHSSFVLDPYPVRS